MATTMASQRFEFPMPERALPRVRITQEQHEDMRAFAVRTALEVLREGPTWGRTNVKAARERGWKVSRRNSNACFMMKTTSASKPMKPMKPSSTMAPVYYTSHSQSSADESPKAASNPSSNESANTTIPPQRGAGGAGGRAFMGSVRLPGYTLDDVISSLHCETTRGFRNLNTKSYGDAYLDCAMIQTLEGAKPHDPFWFLGIKWAALKSPFEKLVNHREFVFLEHSGTHVDSQGKRVLYRLIQSICLDDFGGEKEYFGLTRGHLDAAYVYWMEGPTASLQHPRSAHNRSGNEEMDGVLTVCMKGLAHPKGKVPVWLTERYIKRFWKAGWTLQQASNDGGVGAAFDAPVTGGQARITLDLAKEWVSDADRKACALCQKKFRFGRRMRHHCRACGEVICRACTQYFSLSYGGSVGSLEGYSYPTLHNINSTYTTPSTTSRGGQFHHQQQQPVSARLNPFMMDADDDDDLPATLGGGGDERIARSGPSIRGKRLRVSSENDAVMIGKVCRRCVDMKKVAVRRETSRISSVKKGNPSRRTLRLDAWENGRGGGPGAGKPISIDEAGEHDDDDESRRHHQEDLPMLGHEDESDTEFFVPDTPQAQPYDQPNRPYTQHQDQDDTTSEFSIGDFDDSSVTFKPFGTIDFGHHGTGQRIATSYESNFSQSGFSVGLHASESDDDDDDGVVEYDSEPEPELDSVRHKQVGQVAHLTVHEEARFTMPRAPPPAPQSAPPLPPPRQVASNFVLTMARPKREDARLRLEDLLADTDDDDDDDGEEDYSTSPPMRPSALDVSMAHEQKQQTPPLLRTTSAPPLSMKLRKTPPAQQQQQQQQSMEDAFTSLHVGGGGFGGRQRGPSMSSRDSNMSSMSFSSFDADILIDASALDDIRFGSVCFDDGDGSDEAEEETLMARIQHIQDDVLRKQLLSSSASSVASSALTSSFGPSSSRYQAKRQGGAYPPPISDSIPLSESSTISSNDSFRLDASPFADAPPPPPSMAAAAPATGTNAHKAIQMQVQNAIADQAYLLQCILQERERGVAPY